MNVEVNAIVLSIICTCFILLLAYLFLKIIHEVQEYKRLKQRFEFQVERNMRNKNDIIDLINKLESLPCYKEQQIKKAKETYLNKIKEFGNE